MENILLILKETKELSPEELIQIMQERVKVFVVEQNCPYEEVDDKDLRAIHVMLKKDGHLVAYGRIIPPEKATEVSFGRILVVEKYRHLKLGHYLITVILKEIKKRFPQYSVKIQAQAYLENFYASFGFQAVSKVYLEDNIPHVDMVLGENSPES